MNPQDFKALLDSLDRISEAIEGKSDNRVIEIVNRFAVVFRMLKELEKMCDIKGQSELSGEVVKIIRKYAKIAEEVMNEME